MKFKANYILLIVFVLALAVVMFGMAKVDAYQKTKNFEYKVVDTKDERVLNKFGAEGWELHSVIYDGSSTVCFLKRSK